MFLLRKVSNHVFHFPSIFFLNEFLQYACHHDTLTMVNQADFLLQPSQPLLGIVLSYVLIRKQTSSVKFIQGTMEMYGWSSFL